MMMVWDIVGSVLVLAGAGFCLIAAIGVLRFEDVFMRMHASTKAGTLGTGLIMLAVATIVDSTGVIARVFGIIAFLLFTAPIAAHMIGRAAYLAGATLSPRTVCDERKQRKPTLCIAAE